MHRGQSLGGGPKKVEGVEGVGGLFVRFLEIFGDFMRFLW